MNKRPQYLALNNEELAIDSCNNVEGRCFVRCYPRSLGALILLATTGKSHVEVEYFHEVDG